MSDLEAPDGKKHKTYIARAEACFLAADEMMTDFPNMEPGHRMQDSITVAAGCILGIGYMLLASYYQAEENGDIGDE